MVRLYSAREMCGYIVDCGFLKEKVFLLSKFVVTQGHNGLGKWYFYSLGTQIGILVGKSQIFDLFSEMSFC